MKIRDRHDIIGGFTLTALGIFVIVYAQRYEFGDLNRMGPGYFPVALGVLLTVLGLIIAIPALFRDGERIHFDLAPFLLVVGSLSAFAVALKPLGIVLATMISVVISSMASEMSWIARGLLAIGIAAITYGVFIFGLSMVIPVWPWSH
jgi:hypothetical protein